MQSGRLSPGRDITAPRRDNNNRISKPASSSRQRQDNASYMTQDEQALKFVADEDKFVLKQSKKKADIRVREGRAKPVDLLAFNLRFIDADRDVFDDDEADTHVAVPSPEAVLQNLDETQLRELEGEIVSYHTLESNPRNREYWQSLKVICADQRQKLQPAGPDGRVVSAVSADVDKILSPKTYEQLEALEKQVKAKLASDEDIDTDYWEQLLRSLLVWKAKAKLGKVWAAIQEKRAPESHRDVAISGHNDTDARAATPSAPSAPSAAPAAAPGATPGTSRFAHVEQDDFSQATKALYEREVARGIGENEEVFAAEEAVPATAKPQWADKYRPRKPRYFNRVQMGYEWNKYNQTHYDHDNPPPKVVQGYKFNIFYPELIDKTKAPTFKIIREHGRKKGESFAPAGEEDTCLIRFVAGPPYEDVAFRIVDREWDYSAKKDRGFKSSFDKVSPCPLHQPRASDIRDSRASSNCISSSKRQVTSSRSHPLTPAR